ncbi:P-loop containing nucleoside triphosphate hydrolase protein [Parathielavia appendiculata]|uniref:P-loop containing nucleoside triphosphate hydrolase protein n=1 Tax=Parathielavia appendiculata TaxID=2587402 RepID=A0AAN6Z538_9PEZI|nr:P-loop containing nucleoside triphosphate hydrolase protein [Parathielavia appendiculata]
MAVTSLNPGLQDALWPCCSCCRQIWLPSLGQFSPQCLGVLGHIPFWTAIVTVAIRYGARSLWNAYRPVWLRRFAAEKDASPPSVSDLEPGTGTASAGKSWTPWTFSLLLLSVGAIALGSVGAAVWPEYAQLCLASVIPNFISCLILVLERPRTVPGAVFFINSVLLLTESIVLTLIPNGPNVSSENSPRTLSWAAGVCLPLVSLVLMLNMPLRDPLLDSTSIGKPFAEPTHTARSPEDMITLWQWMTISWMAPLINLGYKRQLHNEDVWFLSYEFQHNRLHMLFREITGTVFVRLLKANGLDIIITTALGVFEMLLELAEPVLLKQLLAVLTSEQPGIRPALVYAAITLFARLIRTQSGVFSLWYCRRNYERARGEMITMIHEKTLRRKAFTFPSSDERRQEPPEEQTSPSAGISTATTLTDDESSNHDSDTDSNPPERSKFQRFKSLIHRRYTNLRSNQAPPSSPEPTSSSPASTGKILNILRNDAYEVAQRFWEAPNLTTRPLSFLLSLVLVWRILGPASLSGVLVLLAGMALNVLLTRLLLRVERVRRDLTDAKLQRTSEFVEAIRHLRWYAWQDAWLRSVMESRGAELARRVQSNVVVKAIATVNSLAAYLFPVAAFWAYTVLSGRPLTVDVAFPALDLFAMLQNSLRELPDLVTVLLNAKVAMARIEAFMLEPEKEDLDGDLMGGGGARDQDIGPLGGLEIVLKEASFSWPGSAKVVLEDVSVVCKPGLTLACGKVGIGKTALLQAILGELDQHGGERTVPREMIGYCAQTPWLESMSIRENILFSTGYDKTRFEQVLDACCLRDDLDKFRCKDLTLIGENGVGLSGGQKARVALARAIYSRARILLLDDPIAALDHQTASAILRNLFADRNSPLTAGRLVILVTHRVDIVTPYANQVIEVANGGRVETFDREELEINREELEHLAEIASAAAHATEDDGSATAGEEAEPVPDKFIEDEHRAHGGVLASVYWQYVKAGRLRWWVTMIGFFLLFRVARIGYFWFLKEWGEQYRDRPGGIYRVHFAGFGGNVEDLQHAVTSHSIFQGNAASDQNWLDLGRYLPPPSTDVRPWLVGFLILSLGQVLTQVCSDAALVVIIYKAGKNLFERAMDGVSNATFRFYDVTPVGRLMNRLTSDMGTVDGQIAGQLMSVAWYALGWLSSMAVISTVTPSFLVISIAMTVMFVLIFDRFLPTSQSLRRLETVSLSPLMSNFGTLVEGLTTVRAFRAEPHFQNRIIASTDSFQKFDHFFWCLQAWLQYRFDLLSAVSTFALTLTAILSGLSSGTVGFVLASASNFVQSTHSLCRKYGEMQMQFVSVERVIELLGLDQEPRGTVSPPASWPHYGDDIVFDNVTLCYAPNLDPVLTNVSFIIPGGANVAVTGRTGSGKSTLALSLLGTLHPDPNTGGSIRIGAIDLASVDKDALRRNITFVAQDPVLFPGTLRDNLDPLDERDEAERADVLARVLGGSGSSFTLDSRVNGGGKNLSQGQRQLVGLGRAILRRSPVVILDEATASIDGETAGYIQRLLREELRHSTVITIAHKAEAVQDADFEIVLDRGRVVRAAPRGARLERGL